MDIPPEPDSASQARDPNTDEIDDKYSEVDPHDVAENAADYLDGKPATESAKQEDVA